MLLLSDVVLSWVKAALRGVILALVFLRNAWLGCSQQARDWLWQLTAGYPRGTMVVQWLLRDVGKTHIGTSPRRPTSLGVVLAQQLQDGRDLAQLAALISWAQQQGMLEVFLYDPEGWLQRRERQLEKLVVGGGGCGSSALAIHTGWPALECQPPQLLPGRDAPAPARKRSRHSAPSSPPPQGALQQLQVVLLSAADAHWPLAKAACAAGMAGEHHCPAFLGGGAPCALNGHGCGVGWAAGTQAPSDAAPAGLDGGGFAATHVSAAGGCSSCAPCQCGTGIKNGALAAPWADLQGAVANGLLGSHAAAGEAAAAAARGCCRGGWEGGPEADAPLCSRAAASEAGFGSLIRLAGIGSSRSSSFGGGEGSNFSGGGSRSGAWGTPGDDLMDGRLQSAVEAPAQLKARLCQVAGALVAAEPDLVMVFGDALTLAGYPPWAVRTSEVYHAGRLQQLRAADLHRVLQRYLGTKQRFGT